MNSNKQMKPTRWSYGDLLNFLELKRGHDLPLQDRCDGEYPIIGSNGVTGFHNEAISLSQGVITGRSGTLGKVYFSEKPYWPLNTSLYIVDFKGNTPKYCYYFLKHFPLEKFGTGTGVPTLNRNIVHKQKVVFPPVLEQQKIAEVLSTVDKKIDLIDQKIAETERLKTGLMQKLFSEGVGVQDENGEWQPHAEFQDNGLPMHWGFLKLGSVAKVTSGGTPSRKKASFWENGTIPWITTGEVNFNCITNSSQKITDEGLKNSAAKMFPPDTILMAMYGQGQTRGRVAMLGIEASTNQACAAIICSKNLNPHFCYHYLSSQYEKIRAIGNEGSQKNLNGQIIKDILIPCPNSEEQEQIALVLSTVDEKITLLAKQKSETQQLKKGLMQKLLTGEWRVPVEVTEAA
ncbi:restriction endonuclease subunit S [Vibrio parahaemolyticus]